MGLLIDGRWQDKPQPRDDQGRFAREDAKLRNWVTADGSPGPTGEGGFEAVSGRYHLYVSLACPWAHRTLIMRTLKGLEDAIGVSVVHWHMGENGWSFQTAPGVVPDPIHHARYLHEVYTAAVPDYTGKVTVPVLWDRKRGTIVSNESAEIIRMFNSAFGGVGAKAGDYYPAALRGEIDRVNDRVYDAINNGVYKAGFATRQAAYDEAADALFAELDTIEDLLGARPWLAGDRMTEADIRLFTTLVRFDPVYHIHFKCSRRRLIEYPRIWALAREIFQMPGVSESVDFDHIRRHYYTSHPDVNPSGIIAQIPAMDWWEAAGRG